ncbi:MAG: hypothetical protein WD069_07040 [Planctomycetales bacterium]
MLTFAAGKASHAADGEPAATGKTASHLGEWTLMIVPAGRMAHREFAARDAIAAEGSLIIPAPSSDPAAPILPGAAASDEAAADALPSPALAVRYRTYREAYRAVPFSRAEYLANPSYRHDAAMELLFGQMRPTVIHRHVSQPRPAPTVAAFSPYYYYPPQYDYSRGPYSRYPGLFGYRGGYRLQYYINGSYGSLLAPYAY